MGRDQPRRMGASYGSFPGGIDEYSLDSYAIQQKGGDFHQSEQNTHVSWIFRELKPKTPWKHSHLKRICM